MKTPIADFAKKYAKQKAVRLHMPGHKGKSFLGFEKYDITEISGADVLYDEGGIIGESQKNAASLFGTEKTVYSCEGSSLSIRAAIYLIKKYAEKTGKNPLIIASRNAHKSFVSALALNGVGVSWLYPKTGGIISSEIDFNELEQEITEKNPTAVYITSPDYLGNIADIKKIAEITKKHNCILAVDNAHGAYLKFLSESRHPIDFGADIVLDSAHKTLPVLTGGGYLHIGKSADRFFSENVNSAMKLFASTSPSYLILESLDYANKYLSKEVGAKLLKLISELDALKTELADHGFSLVGNEPMKLTLAPKKFGYKGEEIAEILEKNNIYPEFSDPDFLVLMFSPENTGRDIKRVKKVLLSIDRRKPIGTKPPKLERAEAVTDIKTALFSESERVKVKDSLGRVVSGISASCPPAVLVLAPGERVNETAISAFKYYKTKTVEVIKE